MPFRVLLAWALVLGATSLASAQRVVVERFGGAQSARLRGLLIQSLEENGVEIVPEDEYRAALREAGLRTPREEDHFVALARLLRVSAFVDGRVSRVRRQWTLRVTVRNGADGTRLGASSWTGRNLAALRGVRRTGHTKLSEHLGVANAPPEAIAQTTETVADPNAAPWYAAGEEETPPPTETPEEPAPEGPSDPKGYAGVRIALLGGTLRRSMVTDVLVDSALRSPFEGGARMQEQRLYESAGLGHMELGFSFELFPDAFVDRPTIPWLGLAVQYRHSMLLDSQGPSCLPAQEPDPALVGDVGVSRGARCPNVDVVPVRTTQQEVYAGLRLEPNVGDDIRGPWLTFDAGYGLFQFVLDPDDLAQLERTTIVPPMDYRYVHLGGGIRYGLHPMFFVGAHFAYRVGLDVGVDAKRIWGADTGRPTGLLVGGELRHEMTWLADGVFAALTVEWFRFTTIFRGQTSCASGADCADYELWEPWPETDGVVDGGIRDPVDDDYLRLSLQIGWAYR
ncbi:MAG: hypothetical protein H6721_28450 [Sandaracinus sp.]|nr:hypothetical protein [Sandaracinus sp.]